MTKKAQTKSIGKRAFDQLEAWVVLVHGALSLIFADYRQLILYLGLLCTAFYICFVWFFKKEEYVSDKLACSLIAPVILVLPYCLPAKITCILSLACFYAAVIYSGIANQKIPERIVAPISLMMNMVFLLANCRRILTYCKYQNGFFSNKLLYLSILAIVLVGGLTYFRKPHRYPKWARRKDQKKDYRMTMVLLAVMTSLIAAPISLMTLNYAIDIREPTATEVVIEAKREKAGSRRRRSLQQLVVTLEGEQRRIDVPTGVYRAVETGDTVTVYKHNGALGEAYYTIEQ